MSAAAPADAFSALFPFAAFAADSLGRVCGWSARLAHATGRSAEEVRGRRLRQVLPAGWAPAAESALLHAASAAVELPLGGAPGTLWIEATGGDDAAEGIVAVWRPAVVAATAPRPAPSPAAALLALDAPLSVLRCGPDGRVRAANAHAASLLGVGPDALVGRPIEAVVAPESVDAVEALWAQARAGAPASARLQRRGADGALRWVQVWCVALRAPGGAVEELLELGLDLSAEQARIDGVAETLLALAAGDATARSAPLGASPGAPWLDALTSAVDSLGARTHRAQHAAAELGRAAGAVRAVVAGEVQAEAIAQAGAVLDLNAGLGAMRAEARRTSAALHTAAQATATAQGHAAAGGGALQQVGAALGRAAASLRHARAKVAQVGEVDVHARILSVNSAVDRSRGAGAEELRAVARRATEAAREAGIALEIALAALDEGAAAARRAAEQVDAAGVAVGAVSGAVGRAAEAATAQVDAVEAARQGARRVDATAARVARAAERGAAAAAALESAAQAMGAARRPGVVELRGAHPGSVRAAARPAPGEARPDEGERRAELVALPAVEGGARAGSGGAARLSPAQLRRVLELVVDDAELAVAGDA